MTRASLFVVACFIAPALAGAADSQPVWSTPSLIVSESDANIYEPVLAVDQAGRLQLAWSTHLRAEAAPQRIDLARWDGSTWSSPTAVITAPSASAPSLAADAFADLHLTWLGTNARLFFTTARAATSTMPAAWSENVDLAQSNIHARLRADATGRLQLTYPGQGAGGPMYRSSDNGGAWWSDAVAVAAPSGADAAADYTRIDAAADGTLHVVWTEFFYPQAWPPRGVFHSRSTDGGRSWTAATQLAGEGFDQINVVTIDSQTVHVAWNGMAGVHGRYHRVSHDGGASWSAPDRLSPDGGTEGPPQLVVDAAHNVHAITTYDTAAWHMVWNGERWSTPTCLSCTIAPAPTLVEEPTAVIRNGNELHVVFWDGRHRLWHTWATLDAPSTAPPPLRVAEWWSSRFWYREGTNLPLLIGIAASLALARLVRLRRTRRLPTTIPSPLAGEGQDGGAYGKVPSAPIGRVAFFPSAEYLSRNAYWPLLKQALGTAGVEVLPSTPMTFGRRWLWANRREVQVLHLHFIQPFYAYESVHARLRWVLRFARNLLFARAVGYVTVFTLHDLRPSIPLRPAWVDYLGHWVAANLSDRVIVHCAAAAAMLRARYGRRAGVHVVEHPNYIGVYPAAVVRADARARLDVREGTRVFLFIGGLRAGKGVGSLVDAFGALPDNARLVIAGEPHLPDTELARLHAQAGRDPRIRLELRYIPDDEVGVFLAAADVVVLPFSEVLTSASAILAMSFARPVVAPARGCLPELLADDAGLLYDPAATDGLLEVLRRCMTEDLSAIGAAGFERVRSRTWQAAAAQTIAVYRAALARDR